MWDAPLKYVDEEKPDYMYLLQEARRGSSLHWWLPTRPAWARRAHFSFPKPTGFHKHMVQFRELQETTAQIWPTALVLYFPYGIKLNTHFLRPISLLLPTALTCHCTRTQTKYTGQPNYLSTCPFIALLPPAGGWDARKHKAVVIDQGQ